MSKKKKACKQCKMFVEEDSCPMCHSESFSQTWQGRIYIADAARSEVAQKVGLKVKGEYAIKVK